MILHDSFNKISCFFLGFIYHLISIVAYLVFVVFRFTVNILLDKNKYRMMESGFESIMADNHGGTSPSNVIIIFKCTGTPSIEKIVDKLYQIVKFETTLVSGGCLKTPYQPFKKLGYAIVKKWGVSCWNIVHNFRAENHLVIDKVNRHLDVEIQERCERLLDTFHPNHQPQWEINILERYESKEYAFIWSIHHSYTDGTIFTQMVRHVLADEPFPIKIDPLQWNIKEAGFYSRIANVIKTLFFCTVGSGWFASMYGRGLGQAILAENDLNEKRGRSHCRSLTLDFNDLKTIQRNVSKKPRVRLVSVLYSCVSRAFERAISSSKSKKPSSLIASTIEADYPYKSLELCVNVYAPWFDLPLNIKDPQERLRVIEKRIRKATAPLQIRLLEISDNLLEAVISLIPQLLNVSRLLTQSISISNMVGPDTNFTIFGGDLVTSMYVYSPIIIDEVVDIDTYTYGGKMTLAMVASDRVIQKLPGFLDDFVSGIKNEMVKYIELSKQNEMKHNK